VYCNNQRFELHATRCNTRRAVAKIETLSTEAQAAAALGLTGQAEDDLCTAASTVVK
jgi:hypothetical protein